VNHKRTDPEFHDPFRQDDVTKSDPPPRDHARPSVSEIQLVRHERRKVLPSLLPPPAPAEEDNDPRTAAQITAALCDRKIAEARATLF
jgi:hypothetical protein